MEKVISEYFQILIECFHYDVDVFGKWWLYAPLCIPAACYLAFFMIKWVVLSAPIWLPVSIVFRSLSFFIHSLGKNGRKNKNRIDE